MRMSELETELETSKSSWTQRRTGFTHQTRAKTQSKLPEVL